MLAALEKVIWTLLFHTMQEPFRHKSTQAKQDNTMSALYQTARASTRYDSTSLESKSAVNHVVVLQDVNKQLS